ncbi:hypothetical protein Mgra_00008031 [Meloidogyne graminicola]|uniref:Chitinase domain-containing protein 1 n=1 Tax=Meloidogyne graminicola TaxID=189291 RepID=A0A8S9ZGZ5_9BILA|nr:hypothetical protein Mgra_00008031 [Meloidogyne graminicola]
MSKGDHFPARTIYYLNQQPRLQEDKPQRSVYIVHQQQQGMEQNTQNFPPNLPPFSSVSMPSTTALISSRSSTQSPQIISSSASRSSASSPALMSSSNDTIVQPSEQDILKCAHFFKSLLKMRPHQSFNLLDMKNLLRDVLLGEQSPEEFTVKLRGLTKSQDKGNLLPFLRRSLPSLRRSIQNGEHLDLRQALDIDESCPSATPQLSNQSDEFSSFPQSQNYQIPTKSPKIGQYSPANSSIPSNPKSVENIQNSLDNYKFVRSTEASTFKKEELTAITEQSLDSVISPQTDNNADNLNNLPKMLLNPQALADRILARMPDADGVDGEVLAVISNATEARLTTILTHLAILAEHRLEPLRANPLYSLFDDPRKQIRFMEDIDKRAHTHRQTAEKEALLKITKSKGKDKDALEKAKQMQKADREAMVNREANAAAFAALGGSRIGGKRPFAPTLGGTVDWKSGLQNQGLSSGLTGASKIARLKRVTMRDFQFYLETDPLLSNNSRLRHRIALCTLCADENGVYYLFLYFFLLINIMSSGFIIAALGLTAVGYSGRYLLRNKQSLTKIYGLLPKRSFEEMFFSKYERGGFEQKMTRTEAAKILGVSSSSKIDKIRIAYKRVMIANHPDRGGSPYLASKINEAKDLLEEQRMVILKLFIVLIFVLISTNTLCFGDENYVNDDGSFEIETFADDEMFGNLQEKDEDSLKDEILNDYQNLDVGKRNFVSDITLGYVTPWNNHGYDVAKWAAQKFTHISPVWFQLKTGGGGSCQITGTHDIDKGWMDDIRKNNSKTLIVPRFLFEAWPVEDLKNFLFMEEAQRRCVKDIINLLQKNQMDGAVIELWVQIMTMTKGSASDYLLEIVEFWSKEFHKAGLLFILPIMPALDANFEETGIVNRDIMNRLMSSIDYLNVMTYDYNSPQISGVAPYEWVKGKSSILY